MITPHAIFASRIYNLKRNKGIMNNSKSSKRKILYLASKNRHKLQELQSMISQEKWDIRLATDLNPDISWDETGSTFLENARIKALALKEYTNEAVLADDSGLMVDFLNGAPGVFSSRFSGNDGDDHANNQKLLSCLNGIEDEKRSAQFLCCLVHIDANDEEYSFEGICKGRILHDYRGENGFGYDPIFLIEELDKAMAELSSQEKSSISHRRLAIEKWKEHFNS